MLTNDNMPKEFRSSHNMHTSVEYNESTGEYEVVLTVNGKDDKGVDRAMPLGSLIYWYPLYFHYTWSYAESDGSIILKPLRAIPKVTKDWIERRKRVTLDSLVGDKDDFEQEGYYHGQEDNLILQDNMTLTTQFASMGLVTWLTLDEVNKETCERNSTILNSIINNIHDNCLKRYRDDTDSKPLVGVRFINDDQGVNKDALDSAIYQYATDYELTLLMQTGCAYTMNNLLRKIVKAKEGK